MSLSALDLTIIVAYFAAIFGVAFYFARRRKSDTTGYFLAGRSVGWFAIGASLFATNISSEHFVGLAGSGAAGGLAVGHFEWLACLIVLLLGWIFAPFYLNSQVFTMPEFLERRYGAASRWYLTGVSIVAYVLTKVSVTLLAGSLLLNVLLGWDVYTSAIVLVLATGLYTVIGGLTAVIYTEMVQAVILIGGALALTLLGLSEVGGLDGLVAKTPPDYWSMFKAMDHPDFPWTGIVFGAPILGIWYWCTDQYIVQRVLSARGLEQARSGAIFAGYLKILPVFILVLPGVIAHALYPDVAGDQAYPAMVSRLLPAGVKGIVIASLLAALMSSLASCFNSASTLFTMDVYKKLKPDTPEGRLVAVGRIATGVIVLLGILWVPFIKVISSQLYVYLQSVQAYISPPIAAVFLFGILWSRANAKGSIAALLTGLVIGATRLIGELLHKQAPLAEGPLRWMVEMNFLHFATFLFVLCSIMLVVVSLSTPAPALSSLTGLTFRHTPRLERIVANPKLHRLNLGWSVLLVALVFILWGLFF
ncbi:MAG: sodium/solute symporter [Calditrichaeota bacterium]|nr:sodium/solute symporter [Calditrichota bacterium]MCB9367199.1 sodium/solute symporter [Calditrichota bacterium]